MEKLFVKDPNYGTGSTSSAGTKQCPLNGTCKEGKCAWWDRNAMECAVYALSISLNNINETLQWAARLKN
jgi:hypothetical protein